MGANIVVTGMVLQTIPIGEYDKRITILTKERGKINAFAKGARRPSGMLLAATNPFVFGEFELYQGRTSYTVAKANVTNYFRELTNDYETACYGFYFLEMADYFAMEQDRDYNLLKLLYVTMRALENPNLDNRLVRSVYELKMLMLNGTYPDVFQCMECQSEDDMEYFDLKRAGVLCHTCAEKCGFTQGVKLLPSTFYAMQFILTAPIEKLYTFKVASEILEELERTIRNFYATYIEHKFKSEAFII
jgi:DNA repair protein RecO (recombination protein O)